MRAKTHEPYRVYTEDEFFAEDGHFTVAGGSLGDEPGSSAGTAAKSTDGRRAYGARRAAGVAMLIGTVGAVVVVLAIDALPHAGGSRRRGALLRVAAREAAHGTSVPTRPLSSKRLQRGLARQPRRGGRSARPARERVTSAGPPSQANRAPQDEVAVSQPAEASADRGEVAHAELAGSSEVPVRSRPEEFGFER
jgi:hypothetical protein